MEDEAWWLGERSNTFGMTRHLGSVRKATRTKSGKRKLRLLGCGCCRLIWPHLSEAARDAVELAEKFADGAVERQKLDAMLAALTPALSGGYTEDDPGAQPRTATALAAATLRVAVHSVNTFPYSLAGYCGPNDVATALVCDLIRDIFGNPFRPVAFSPSWRTEAVVALARTMYDARDFAPMPVLADALDDAGCDDAHILAHCRGPGPHVRGCWVVDLVLGKQ